MIYELLRCNTLHIQHIFVMISIHGAGPGRGAFRFNECDQKYVILNEQSKCNASHRSIRPDV